MKKFLASLLLLCICLTALTACQSGGEPAVKLGEPITAETWQAWIAPDAHPCDNFTSTFTLMYGSTGMREEIVRCAGNECIVTTRQGENEFTRGYFLIDGVLGSYEYDPEAKKWSKMSIDLVYKSTASPLECYPHPLEEMTYDEETGGYSYEKRLDAVGEDDTELELEAYFQQGNLVFLRGRDTVTESYFEWRGSDFGTTVVKRPDASEIK